MARLRGRGNERETLEALIEGARGGTSGVLVLHGEAGIGKTALLDDLAARAAGCQIARRPGLPRRLPATPRSRTPRCCSPRSGVRMQSRQG